MKKAPINEDVYCAFCHIYKGYLGDGLSDIPQLAYRRYICAKCGRITDLPLYELV